MYHYSQVTSSIGSNNAKYTVTTNKRLPRVSFKEQDPEVSFIYTHIYVYIYVYIATYYISFFFLLSRKTVIILRYVSFQIGSSFHRNIKVRNTINDKEQNNKGQETDDDSDDENNDDDDVIEKYSSTTNEVIVIYAKYKHK